MQATIHSVSKVIDKVSPTQSQTMSFHCDGPVNAMAMNKDMNLVVVAGRQVFKVIAIEDDKFSEVTNLRAGKQKTMNLSYSAADVAWNHNDEYMLASAATNGAVVIWNINKQAKSKQEYVFMEHKRSVNRVVFHSSEAHQLLSGSQDGTMMLHDVRRKQVSVVFVGRSSESVRDIQFSPPNLNYFTFAAAYENGIVQIWDMRRPDRCEKQFTAHNEPVFAVDWHPEDRNWLATAGRDKMIKVWEVNKQPAQLAYGVQTIASVGRVKWRPMRNNHIASCALLLDHSVSIWDIRRPYIPFASFDEHKDVATCLIWKDDPHVFLSTGKDGFLIQHVFSDAKRPADCVIPCGVDVSIYGDVCFAYQDKTSAARVAKETASKFSLIRKSVHSRSDLFFTEANSAMTVFQQMPDIGKLEGMLSGSVQSALHDVSMVSFIELAKSYRLKGLSIEDLCQHNANIATSLDKHHIAHSWLMLEAMYGLKNTMVCQASQPRTTSVTPSLVEKQDTDKGKSTATVSSPDREMDKRAKHTEHEKDKHGDCSSGSDDGSDEESSEYEKNLANIASGFGYNGDFFFGDGDGDMMPLSMGFNFSVATDWSQIPVEAFQPRHDLTGHTTPPDRLDGTDHEALLVAAAESGASQIPAPADDMEQSEEYLNLMMGCYTPVAAPTLDFTNIVVQTIKFFAEHGDVQTSVSMIIVLGDHVRMQIDEESQENWFLSYIDLLSQFELWTIANEIIRLSHLPQVNQLNQSSTIIHTACPQCSRPMERVGWLCDRCKIVTNLCSVCHLPVKGVSVWCQGCCHGGHLHHMQEWLSLSMLCPAGCGHHCEYT